MRRTKIAPPSPGSTPAFRLFGEIPYGGEADLPVLRGVRITDADRPGVIRACHALIETARYASAVPSNQRITTIDARRPIDPFALEEGIRELYDRNAWISPLDVMIYAARVVDRLLVELGERSRPREGGYPTDRARMARQVERIHREVQQLLGRQSARPPTTWLVATLGDDRQYGGNQGYADELATKYRYDSRVPNHARISAADVFVLRDRSRILGVARVREIERFAGAKWTNLCPECGLSGIKPRSRKLPEFRCYRCEAEFSTPRVEVVDVTEFVAHYAHAFVPLNLKLDMAEMRGACVRPNDNLSMQEIDVSRLGSTSARLAIAMGQLHCEVPLPPIERELTSDDAELDRRVRRLLGGGTLQCPPGQRTPPRIAGAGTRDRFLRDPAVKAWVIQEARGTCEACRRPGPFATGDGEVFLEVHHVTPLAEGGPDTPDNAVAICPNCHRALHLATDRLERRRALIAAVSRLTGTAVVAA
jgi:hypothetical protein